MEIENLFEITFANMYKKTENQCFDMESLCAYTDNSTTLSNRKSVEEHMMNCSRCFDLYVSICQEKNKTEEGEYKTPEWLKSKVLKKNNFSFNLFDLISIIRQGWSWLSWCAGLGSGIAIALVLIVFFLPGFFKTNPDTEQIKFPTQLAGSSTPTPFSMVIETGHTDSYSAEFHYKRGEEIIKSSPEKARAEFIKAIQYNQDYAEAHWQLALIYEKENNYKEAKRHWKRYINLVPRIGSYEEAKKHLKESLDAPGE